MKYQYFSVGCALSYVKWVSDNREAVEAREVEVADVLFVFFVMST